LNYLALLEVGEVFVEAEVVLVVEDVVVVEDHLFLVVMVSVSW
jgi:hypothetical protein